MSRAWAETAVYVRHIAALFYPGVAPGEHLAHPKEPAALDDWSPEEQRLLIEEGRRQLDRQRGDLERVQTRGQFLFTAAAAILTVVLSQTDQIEGALVAVLWTVGLAAIAAGLLGAAALMSVRAAFGGIDVALLSHQEPNEVLHGVAAAYSRAVRTGENTVATRITVFRDAVFLVVLGGAAQTIIWLVSL